MSDKDVLIVEALIDTIRQLLLERPKASRQLAQRLEAIIMAPTLNCMLEMRSNGRISFEEKLKAFSLAELRSLAFAEKIDFTGVKQKKQMIARLADGIERRLRAFD